ncbi:hypothetical protein NLI96_g9193 [Meripilus lineatus]|uniref:Uncharacterized protein n=1 Tax=Meripilus lineatus TaxID=2056292 RepID=A0AAD5UY63_9APHY|nr:hypothetical protein NLI96_g9193 [Physisporinus lineatus]
MYRSHQIHIFHCYESRSPYHLNIGLNVKRRQVSDDIESRKKTGAKPKDGPLAELLKEFATPVVTTLTNGKKIATIFPLEPRPSLIALGCRESPPDGKQVLVTPSGTGNTSAQD